MVTTKQRKSSGQLYLSGATAADLMTPSPMSVDQDMTVRAAAQFLTTKEISAAPVIDAAGRPVGVLSRADLVRYVYENVKYASPFSEYYQQAELKTANGERLENNFQVEVTDSVAVREIMTPTVISVEPQTPALEVVAQMLALKVHRLFVSDGAGVLIGVISALDVLRQLRKA
jgi:CBS domain-containing protein